MDQVYLQLHSLTRCSTPFDDVCVQHSFPVCEAVDWTTKTGDREEAQPPALQLQLPRRSLEVEGAESAESRTCLELLNQCPLVVHG